MRGRAGVKFQIQPRVHRIRKSFSVGFHRWMNPRHRMNRIEYLLNLKKKMLFVLRKVSFSLLGIVQRVLLKFKPFTYIYENMECCYVVAHRPREKGITIYHYICSQSHPYRTDDFSTYYRLLILVFGATTSPIKIAVWTYNLGFITCSTEYFLNIFFV